MRAWIEKESKGVQTLIDFNTNCKTGEEEGRIQDVGEESDERKAQSSDKKINVEGRMSRLEKVRWIIFNDNIKEKDNQTYLDGRKQLVINYVIRKKQIREKIIRLKIQDRGQTNHQSLEALIKKIK